MIKNMNDTAWTFASYDFPMMKDSNGYSMAIYVDAWNGYTNEFNEINLKVAFDNAVAQTLGAITLSVAAAISIF